MANAMRLDGVVCTRVPKGMTEHGELTVIVVGSPAQALLNSADLADLAFYIGLEFS
jgi:hypothetical protein